VRWPSGTRQELVDLPSGAHTLREPTVTVKRFDVPPTAATGAKLFAKLSLVSRATAPFQVSLRVGLTPDAGGPDGMPPTELSLTASALPGVTTLSLPVPLGHSKLWQPGSARVVLKVEGQDGARDQRAPPITLL
jgi:hypothetical protein